MVSALCPLDLSFKLNFNINQRRLIELRAVQFWSEIILVISIRIRAARSFDFEITTLSSITIIYITSPAFKQVHLSMKTCSLVTGFIRSKKVSIHKNKHENENKKPSFKLCFPSQNKRCFLHGNEQTALSLATSNAEIYSMFFNVAETN